MRLNNLTLSVLLSLIFILPARAEESALRLYTFNCGDIKVLDLNVMDDTDSYAGQTKDLSDSCYLIQHRNEYMLWDTGLPTALIGKTEEERKNGAFLPSLQTPLVELLAGIDVKPENIKKIGISHVHFDHIGQAANFKGANLLIGEKDYNLLFSGETAAEGFDKAPLENWAAGTSVTKVSGDYDVFGDGSVIMLSMPGHTPGHSSLQVNLKNSGTIILSGDLYHFHENMENGRLPDFNTSREETLASFAKMKEKIDETKARFIIQHDPEDFKSMPTPPAYLD